MSGLVTVLDFLIVAACSAVAVVLLGGRTAIPIGPVTLVLKSPLALGVIAGALVALRLLHWRGVPLLPALSRGRMPIDEERRRLAAPPPITPRVAWYAAAAIAGSLVWVLPQLLHLRDVPDAGDPIFSAWRIAALAHQLATDPRHLWDGNIFYPLPLTLTYSDSTLLQALLGAPFLLAGADPLVVMNALLVAAFPARGLACFFVGWRLTGDPQAGLVAALAGAGGPFYAEHYSHLELQWTAFVPLTVYALMRLFAAPGWKGGLGLGVAVAAQCLACMYVAVMLVSSLVPMTAVLLLAWRVRPSRQLAAGLAAAALVVLPIVGGLGAAYMKGRAAHGDRSVDEVLDGSATGRNYRHAPERLVGYGWMSREGHHVERELFPGGSPLALALAGMVPPVAPGALAALAGGVAAFDWSLGLRGMTYGGLYRGSAVYRGMRVPARFSVMVEAALALLAAYGAARLLRLVRSGPARAAACVALCALVLVDLRIDPFLQSYPRGVPPIYRHVKPRMVLAELPGGRPFDYMYYSTRHWAKLLTGSSGFNPDLSALHAAEAAFPSDEAVAALHELGATHLTYNCALDKMNGTTDAECGRVFDALAANRSLALIASEQWRGSEVRLYAYR